MTCPGIKGVPKGQYCWKVVKSTFDPDKFEIEFFRSDLQLLDHLDFVLNSYEPGRYFDFNGNSEKELINQAEKVGNEMIERDGYGILEVIRLK